MVAKGEGGIDWEFGISRCKLLYTGWINKIQLYSTENCVQYTVINHNGKGYEKEYVCVCVYTNWKHFVAQQKLPEHCKPTTLQKNKLLQIIMRGQREGIRISFVC